MKNLSKFFLVSFWHLIKCVFFPHSTILAVLWTRSQLINFNNSVECCHIFIFGSTWFKVFWFQLCNPKYFYPAKELPKKDKLYANQCSWLLKTCEQKKERKKEMLGCTKSKNKLGQTHFVPPCVCLHSWTLIWRSMSHGVYKLALVVCVIAFSQQHFQDQPVLSEITVTPPSLRVHVTFLWTTGSLLFRHL